mgnify:CR=1 FL=1
MKKNYFLIFLLFYCLLGNAQNDSLLKLLEKELQIKNSYVESKYRTIDSLKQKLQKVMVSGNDLDLYYTYNILFKEYRSFKYDSAYMYVENAKEIARKINNDSLIAEAKINEGFVLLSSGLFKEAVDTLSSIDTLHLSPQNKYYYYYTRARSNFDLAEYNNDDNFRINYTRNGIQMLEKAQLYVPKSSSDYWASESLEKMKKQEWAEAEESYLHWINDFNLSPNEYAVATSSLSFIYSWNGESTKAIHYLALAAISDIRNATKENTALRNLSNELYIKGDLERANKYVNLAMEDAKFYNARHRKIELSSILPILEEAQLYKAEQKNATLEKIIIVLIILAALSLLFLVIIFKQLKEKNRARQALTDNNEKLKETNLHLMEIDAIKQDYITYFLKVTSQLINKIDSIQKSTLQKVKTKRPEEILRVLKKYSVKQERNELFHQFDEVFLKLFPKFIKEINKLLPPEEKKVLKKDELLNTELRIYALYRLGVQNPKQVAEFLEISVATIYTYKTRLKNKSKFKNNFEEKIMEIRRF